jgi:deoxyribodipyrimidine photo-lyase
MVDERRVTILRDGSPGRGPVVYWMSRDQRVRDNWALLHSQDLALGLKVPLIVVFCLVPGFLNAAYRQYAFMLKGLRQVEERLAGLNIAFRLLRGDPADEIPRFLTEAGAGALVTDFDPLRVKRQWKESVVRTITIPMYEVDAHNIVPCRAASQKQEYAAYTIRPKIRKALPSFLHDLRGIRRHLHTSGERAVVTDWDALLGEIVADRTVPEVTWLEPGEGPAGRALKSFIQERLPRYHDLRNDPARNGQSDLSPYLHFGHLACQRVALEVLKADVHRDSIEGFIEELIVRRELSDNFCFYNANYDSFKGFPAWARKSLDEERHTGREYLYSAGQFEAAATHDELWNAAQSEMVQRGKMHGYMRMYWAKKILQWTESPEQAMDIAIRLNDRYELDGRDPNGYAGIAWSIGGVHDRAWPRRPVFGKVRYMSHGGCRSKFDVDAYIARWQT